MKKPKRRWAWTSKQLRKTRSKDQRYNDINFVYRTGGGKGSWRVNRRYLKQQTDLVAYYTNLEWLYFDSSAFYGDKWLDCLPYDHHERRVDRGDFEGMDWCEFDYYRDYETPFPKEVYVYDFSGYLADVTPFLRCGDAIDLGLKKHKKAWSPWDHPYW